MKVFCDFDGTTAENDVGSLLFRTFSDHRCFEIVRRWKAGQITSRECLTEECRIARVTQDELTIFADGQKLDPYFSKFVVFCQNRMLEIEIVSDGLDFYIERILNNHGLLGKIGLHANHLVFRGKDRIDAEFPYFEKGCGKCGNCKGYHVKHARSDHDKVVYVGDGLSDRCGVKEADIVFAKKGRDLVRFCDENKIPYHEFSHFNDIEEKLTALLR